MNEFRMSKLYEKFGYLKDGRNVWNEKKIKWKNIKLRRKLRSLSCDDLSLVAQEIILATPYFFEEGDASQRYFFARTLGFLEVELYKISRRDNENRIVLPPELSALVDVTTLFGEVFRGESFYKTFWKTLADGIENKDYLKRFRRRSRMYGREIPEGQKSSPDIAKLLN